MSIVIAVVLGICAAGVMTGWRVARARSARCPHCPGRPCMRRAPEDDLARRLSPTEQTERRIGATHFRLQACPRCRWTQLDARPAPGWFVRCSRCSARAARERHVTVRPPTRDADGMTETRAACEHCHTIDVTYAAIPRTRGRRGGAWFAGHPSSAGWWLAEDLGPRVDEAPAYRAEPRGVASHEAVDHGSDGHAASHDHGLVHEDDHASADSTGASHHDPYDLSSNASDDDASWSWSD